MSQYTLSYLPDPPASEQQPQLQSSQASSSSPPIPASRSSPASRTRAGMSNPPSENKPVATTSERRAEEPEELGEEGEDAEEDEEGDEEEEEYSESESGSETGSERSDSGSEEEHEEERQVRGAAVIGSGGRSEDDGRMTPRLLPTTNGSANVNHMSYDEKYVEKGDIGHVEEAQGALASDSWAEIKAEAERGEAHEHSLTLWESLKIYKAACLWAAAASAAIIMEGYDTALLSSFWGLPAFREHYGEYLPDKQQYQVPAEWQVAIGQAPIIGNFFGIFWGSWLIDRYGYRMTLLINMSMMIPFIAVVTFSPNKIALMIGEMLCGIPWGVFSTLAEAYSSEVCPLSLRGYLTTYVNLCWVIGQFISAGVILGIQGNITGEWAYRLPFAIQWIWPPPLLVLIYLSPESPWWLVRHGRLEEAERSVKRLASKEMKDRARDTVAMMVRTNQLEVDLQEGTSYIDCFRGTDIRRTEISVVAWGCQQFCGLPFAGWAVYFFQQAGLSEEQSFKLGLGNTAGAFMGTLGSWFLITHFGRRPIFLYGMAWLSGGQILIGILSIVADQGSQGAKWAQAAVMMLWVFSYDFTVGPLAYCIVGESSSTRLRNKTIGLSRNFYNILGIIAGIITPYMLNPGKWNWAGKTGFFWAPIAITFTVWTYYRLPEMKGRSYYELDILFERGVRARDFSRVEIEADADDNEREAQGIETR